MNPFTEDNLVEQTVIKLIKELWADDVCHPPSQVIDDKIASGDVRPSLDEINVGLHINAYTDAEDARLGRDNRGEVVLKKFLVPALKKFNPGLTDDGIAQAV